MRSGSSCAGPTKKTNPQHDREQQPDPTIDEDHGCEGATGNGAGPIRPRQGPDFEFSVWRAAGGEIIEALAEAHGEEPFAMHVLETQPDMDRGAIRKTRNQYWNAFKHFSDRKGFAREDEDLLSRFDDTKNDAALFVGWWGLHDVARSACQFRRRYFRSGGTRSTKRSFRLMPI